MIHHTTSTTKMPLSLHHCPQDHSCSLPPFSMVIPVLSVNYFVSIRTVYSLDVFILHIGVRSTGISPSNLFHFTLHSHVSSCGKGRISYSFLNIEQCPIYDKPFYPRITLGHFLILPTVNNTVINKGVKNLFHLFVFRQLSRTIRDYFQLCDLYLVGLGWQWFGASIFLISVKVLEIYFQEQS